MAFALAVVGSVLFYAWWTDSWMFTGEFKPGPTITMEISEITIGQNMVGKVANGTVINDSEQQYERVQVAIDLYDADGELVGEATEEKALLEPGQEWNFSAFILDESAVTAELKGVTGYQ